MRRGIIVLLCLIFCAFNVHSQEENNHLITGKVIDAESKEVLEYATITFSGKSSTKTLGTITDNKGKFEIIVPEGKYTIIVEYLAYKTITLKSQVISNSTHYGSIELSQDTEIIESIKIIGEKKTVELKPKKLIYNVKKDIAAQGGMITEVLNNIPSITIENNTPMVRGQRATVMVNGKTSTLSKEDALKSLPAGSVEKVEVITSPGAQYKASYKSIINIILKKGKDEGLNASITASAGFKDIYGGLLTLNYKSKGVNFFTNASYSNRNQIRLFENKNRYLSGGVPIRYLNEELEFDSKNQGIQSTVGADFEVSKNTTITTSVNYTNLNYDRRTHTKSHILDTSFNEISNNMRDYDSDFKNEIMEFLVEGSHNFSNEGQTLNGFVKYSNDIEKTRDVITNTNPNFNSEAYKLKNKLINTEVDLNFTSPLTDAIGYTAGINSIISKLPFRNDTGISNIDYNENVHAAFVDVNFTKGNFYIEAGMRGEFSKSNVDYLDFNINQERKLNKFFPSAYAEYTISDSKLVSFYYGKNIERADFSRLQPFEERFSETSSFIGNERLQPMTMDTYSLDFTYSKDRLTIVPALYFTKFNEYWQDVTYETGEQIDGISKLITTPQNVGYVNLYGLNLTTTYKATNNINFTFNTSLYNFDQHGIFETTNVFGQPVVVDFNRKSLNGDIKLLSQFNFPDVIKFQTNIVHNLISEGPISTRKAYTYASFGASKDLLEKKGTLSLNVSDIFNSNQIKRDRFDTNYFSSSINKNKYPDVVLSFTYRFNQSKNNRKINFDKKDKKPKI